MQKKKNDIKISKQTNEKFPTTPDCIITSCVSITHHGRLRYLEHHRPARDARYESRRLMQSRWHRLRPRALLQGLLRARGNLLVLGGKCLPAVHVDHSSKAAFPHPVAARGRSRGMGARTTSAFAMRRSASSRAADREVSMRVSPLGRPGDRISRRSPARPTAPRGCKDHGKDFGPRRAQGEALHRPALESRCQLRAQSRRLRFHGE